MISISKVFFELRVRSPHKPRMPLLNRRYLIYIGQRKGALVKPGLSHGLFGHILGQPAESAKNIQDLGRYIEEKTKAKTHVYSVIISLSEADALRTGYDDFAAWEELVRAQIPLLAEKAGIKIQNLEWGAGVHMQKGNPHCHLLFWDKDRQVKNPFIHWTVASNIRHTLTKEIYKEEIERLYQMKNEARAATLTASGAFFQDFLSSFADLSEEELLAAMAELKSAPDLADSGLIYNRFSGHDLAELARDIFELKEKLPKTGRLHMKFMPEEQKAQIKALAVKLLELNVDCRREFDRYVESAVEIASYHASNKKLPEARRKAEGDMLYRLCNKILTEMKTLSKMEREAERHVREEEWRKQLTASFITEVFGFLSRYGHAEENRLHRLKKSGDLSKQAKKELALEQKNSAGCDWEQ